MFDIKKSVQSWLVWLDWSIIPYTERLGVRFLVGAHMGGNQSMFLPHIDVLSLSLPCLSPLSLSLKSINIKKTLYYIF